MTTAHVQGKYFAKFLLAGLILVGLALTRLGLGNNTQVTLAFITTTAPHAALGVPMSYQMTLTNTGTGTTQVTAIVNLIAPDSSSYQLLSTSPKLTAGQILLETGTFTTSTYTSQTGSFNLVGEIADGHGTILQQLTLALSVVADPSNGVYVSIGGQGPPSALLGYTTDFQTVTANLATTSQTLQTKVILLEPGSKQVSLSTGALQTFNPGTNTIVPGIVTTSQYGGAGNYALMAEALDNKGNVLATDTYNLSRTALPTSYYAPTFTDVASTAGINVSRTLPNKCGTNPDFIYGGSGAAVADYNADGLDDLYVVDSGGLGHLWKNNGNNTFTDVAAAAGIPSIPGQSGATFADIDNDGYPDLLILVAEGNNVLLHNNGDGTFTDITATAGINANPVVQNNIGATWGDYDNDGYLDLYIVIHLDCSGANSNDHLYHNNHDNTFTDMTSLLGGSTAKQVNGRGLVAAFVDYNQDGWLDLYVGNDEGTKGGPDVLWKNNGDGTFTDVSSSSGAGLALGGNMGIAVGDYNRQGLFDLFLTNYGTQIMLQQQSGGTFVQAQDDLPGHSHVQDPTFPSSTGALKTSIMWGTGFYDFNNDGWEDLYLANGNTQPGTLPYTNTFFLNNQDGTFLNLTSPAGLLGNEARVNPTAVFFDFNNDGFMDFLDGSPGANTHLYRNNGPKNGNPYHWLEVKLIGTTSNRDAVGARLVANVNGVNLLRTVVDGATWQGNNTLVQHFGLGSATLVTTLTIYWPSGMVQTLSNVAVNQKLTVTEP